jgi:hypothetical protein
MCFLAIVIGSFFGFVVLGPSARQHGKDQATLVIEASACGDLTGVVSEGWEERCFERAAKAKN